MSNIIELYARELTKENATMTIEDVPARLREQVSVAVEAKKAEKAGE